MRYCAHYDGGTLIIALLIVKVEEAKVAAEKARVTQEESRMTQEEPRVRKEEQAWNPGDKKERKADAATTEDDTEGNAEGNIEGHTEDHGFQVSEYTGGLLTAHSALCYA